MPRAQVSSKAQFQVKLVSAPDQELIELRDFCNAVLAERRKGAAATSGSTPGRPRKVSKAKAAQVSAKAAEVTRPRTVASAPAGEQLT